LTDFDCWGPDWAPDGKAVSCPWETVIKTISVGDGSVSQMDVGAMGMTYMAAPHYSWDGSTIYVLGTNQQGAQGVWSVATGGGDPTLVVELDPSQDWFDELTIGREHIYLTLVDYQGDIWVADLEW